MSRILLALLRLVCRMTAVDAASTLRQSRPAPPRAPDSFGW